MMSFFSAAGKLVVVGDPTVGKTSLLRTYSSSGFDFSEKYSMTIGVEPNIFEIRIPDISDPVKFLIFDTTGSDMYYGIMPKYWKEPDMALFVYDITNASSFESLSHWLELVNDIKRVNGFKNHPSSSVLFANKTDLIERRAISSEKGANLAAEFKINYFEGSAKTNEGVNEMFQWLAYKWLSRTE